MTQHRGDWQTFFFPTMYLSIANNTGKVKFVKQENGWQKVDTLSAQANNKIII